MANENKDVFRVRDTEANIDNGASSVIRQKQLGFTSDTFKLAFRDTDDSIYLYTPDGTDVTGGDIYTTRYLYHVGDTDTHLDFESDKITVQAGGVDFITITETTQDVIEFNPNKADIDLNVYTSANPTNGEASLAVNGSTGRTTLQLEDSNALSDTLRIISTYENATGETGTQVGIRFQCQATEDSGSSYSNEEMGAIRAYKISDYWTASTPSDMDAGLRFLTTNNGSLAIALTLDNDLAATFAGDIFMADTNTIGISGGGSMEFLDDTLDRLAFSNCAVRGIMVNANPGGAEPTWEIGDVGLKDIFSPNLTRNAIYKVQCHGVFFDVSAGATIDDFYEAVVTVEYDKIGDVLTAVTLISSTEYGSKAGFSFAVNSNKLQASSNHSYEVAGSDTANMNIFVQEFTGD